MKPVHIICAAAMLTMGVSPAFASGDLCTAPKAEWRQQDELKQKLESQGWQVKRIKVDDGCYEAYAIDDKGNRVEAYFDPKSFEQMRKKSDD